MFRIICCLLVILCAQTVLSTNWYDDMNSLLQNEFTGYNRDVIPRRNSDSHVSVSLSPEIKTIEDMNEDLKELSLTLRLTMSWSDERLAWDVRSYNGITEIYVPATKLWVPDISNVNSFSVDVPKEEDKPVTIQFIGQIRMTRFIQVKAGCKMDYTAFPNDQHLCSFNISSWKYSNSHLLFNLVSNVSVDNIVEKSEWSLVGNVDSSLIKETPSSNNAGVDMLSHIGVEPPSHTDDFYKLNIAVTVKRNSSIFRHIFIFPIIILSILFSFHFLLPNQQGKYLLGTLCIIAEIISFVHVCLYTHNSFSLSFIGIIHIVTISCSTCGMFLTAVVENILPLIISKNKESFIKDHDQDDCIKRSNMELQETDGSLLMSNGHSNRDDDSIERINKMVQLINNSLETKKNSQFTYMYYILFGFFFVYFIILTFILHLCI